MYAVSLENAFTSIVVFLNGNLSFPNFININEKMHLHRINPIFLPRGPLTVSRSGVSY